MLANLHQADAAFMSDRRHLDADIAPALVADDELPVSREVVVEIGLVDVDHDVVGTHDRQQLFARHCFQSTGASQSIFLFA